MENELYGLTFEDRAIWARFSHMHRSDCYWADTDDFRFMRDHGDCDHFYLVNAVNAEAYAADMYGTPDYSDVEAA